MAIKISGTTVIDDNRQLTNFTSATVTGNSYVKLPTGTTADRPVSVANGSLRYNIDEGSFEGYAAGEWGALGGAPIPTIDTPINTFPANGDTAVNPVNITFSATSIRHIFDEPPRAANWQVSNTILFTTTEINANVVSTSNSYTSNVTLGGNNVYFWRVKYIDGDGIESSFSTPTQFETSAVPPTVLGQSYAGGYYLGLTCNCDASSYYYLIIAPNATGAAACAWQTNFTVAISGYNGCDGYLATYEAPGRLTCAFHPAGNFTATRTIGGYSDWYLPSTTEMFGNILNLRGNLPPGETYNNCISQNNKYWTSTQAAPYGTAWVLQMYNNEGRERLKTYGYMARAVRREPI